MKTAKPLNLRLNLIGAALATVLAAGCASTPTAAPLAATGYQDVYLVKPEQDPRGLFPRVAQQFEAMGFKVHTVEAQQFLGKAEGSGFLVSRDGHLVTAAHTLEGHDKATVWLDGARYSADVLSRSDDRDLAMLKLSTPLSSDVAPLAVQHQSPLALGQQVYAIGHAQGRGSSAHQPKLTPALVSVAGSANTPHQAEVAGMAHAASGGSPLLSADGRVVGMVQRGQTDTDTVGNRNVVGSPLIADYLRTALPASAGGTTTAEPISMQQAARAVAKVRAGQAEADAASKPRLVATVDYTSVQDKLPRLQDFSIQVRDLDTDRLVVQTDSGHNSVNETEQTVVLGAVKQVRTALSSN